MEIAERLRLLPSVDEVALRLAGLGYPRRLVIAEIRRAIAEAREQLRRGAADVDIDSQVVASLSALRNSSLRRVINATGVILHTNLGRAPLAPMTLPEGYSNLEYDLAAGRRGKRDVSLASPPLPSTTTPPPSISCFRNSPPDPKSSSPAAS
jgi:L-seryl-tRNA(Ser) seleniumtransferase